MSFNIPHNGKKRVIIVGGGFGGLKLAGKLRKSDFQVILIDKNNYHQFPPLIYQVASAGLEPSSICFPFRKLFRRHSGDFHFRMGEVREVIPEKSEIVTSIGRIGYDYLILAAGAETNFFGNAHIEEQAIPMKTVSEAMGLRNLLLSCLERAQTCQPGSERRELLNVVIVGGGATGVEIAGALSEMKIFVLPRDYPDMPRDQLQIYLVEATGRLLPAMSPDSSKHAEDYLRKMGVNICLERKVVDYRERIVALDNGEQIPSQTLIWVSGISAVRIGNLDGSRLGRGGRIRVDAFNRVEGFDNIFAIGDQCVSLNDPAYPNGHPQLAQVAIQQGEAVARNLRNLELDKDLVPFRYRNLGVMATVGRNLAVAEFGKFHMQGWLAWVLWLVVHLRSILGVRNKIIVLLNWVWNYLTYDQSLRMIVWARRPRDKSNQNLPEA